VGGSGAEQLDLGKAVAFRIRFCVLIADVAILIIYDQCAKRTRAVPSIEAIRLVSQCLHNLMRDRGLEKVPCRSLADRPTPTSVPPLTASVRRALCHAKMPGPASRRRRPPRPSTTTSSHDDDGKSWSLCCLKRIGWRAGRMGRGVTPGMWCNRS